VFAVIFRAEVADLDAEYAEVAARMRDIAMRDYGCREFTSCTEGSQEIAISYWDNEDQIKRWKQNAEHLVAQGKGRRRWYKAYSVEVVEIVRSYGSKNDQA
jgi:heme-degrading monooxygenase HmoA